MPHERESDQQQYPHLFAKTFWPWGPIHAQFKRCDRQPSREQVAHVNVVPRLGNRWVIMSVDGQAWDLPGGTLEANEEVLAAARRELLEELGAELHTHQLLGAWHCHSLASQPYRPHLSHPDFLRVVLVGEVRRVGWPTNPQGAEQVQIVDTASLNDAVQRLNRCGRPELAELYQLAANAWKAVA